MVNDHLSDFVTRIRNGYMAGSVRVEMPLVKTVKAVAEVMKEAGYLEDVTVTKKNRLELVLRYVKKKPAVSGIKRVSNPGSRVYASVKGLPRVWGGIGMNIVSTPKGIMADKKARKLNLGGEIVAQLW